MVATADKPIAAVVAEVRSIELRAARLDAGTHATYVSLLDRTYQIIVDDGADVVSLINQERSNNKLYVSLIAQRPTVYSDDKTLPSLPASVLNVMQTGRTASRSRTGATWPTWWTGWRWRATTGCG